MTSQRNYAWNYKEDSCKKKKGIKKIQAKLKCPIIKPNILST